MEQRDSMNLQTVRGIALLLGFTVLVLQGVTDSDIGLLMQRAVVAALALALAGATWLLEAARQQATRLLHALAYVIGVWTTFVTYDMAFQPGHTLVLLATIAGLGVLFVRVPALVLFHGIHIVLVGIAVLVTPDPLTEPLSLLAGLVLIATTSGIVAVSRARTLRMLQEQAQVAQNANTGLALTRADGVIQWANPRLRELEADNGGRVFQQGIGHTVRRMLEQQEATDRTPAEMTLDIDECVLSIRMTPIDGTTPLRTAVVVNDISQRHMRTKRILSVVRDAFLTVNSHGNILYANPAATALLGGSQDTLSGDSLISYLSDGSTEAGHRLLFEVGGPKSQPQTRDLNFNGPGRSTIPTTVVALALPTPAGQQPTVLLVIQDHRPQRELERQRTLLEERLQRAQRLESLETLAGRVAHDANNLLVSVMGHAGLAAMQADNEDDADRFEIIQSAAEQAASLNAQLLSLAGKDGVTAQALDLAEFVEEAEPMLHAALSPQATLRLALARDLPPVTGNTGKLQQSLLGLVRNACEALEGADGTVTIRTRTENPTRPIRIAIDAPLPPGQYAVLEVEDTGMGISAEVQTKMFEPDFSTRAPGRGLGLAATLSIIRAHGGGIVIQSLGTVTRVQIWLPAAPLTAPPPPAQREPISRSGRGAILLVDDEDDVREIAREALERAGHTVITAQNGVQSLRAFAAERSRIRVVLLDLNMPGMRGEEILRRLHTAAPEVPVIITSGYAPHHIDGATAIIHKPYRLRDLIQAVEKVMPKH